MMKQDKEAKEIKLQYFKIMHQITDTKLRFSIMQKILML